MAAGGTGSITPGRTHKWEIITVDSSQLGMRALTLTLSASAQGSCAPRPSAQNMTMKNQQAALTSVVPEGWGEIESILKGHTTKPYMM